MKQIITLLSTLMAMTMLAQEPLKQPTLEELMPGGNHYLRTENRWYTWWDDQTCLQLDIDTLTAIQAGSGKSRTLITLDEVNQLAKAAGMKPLRQLQSAQVVQQAKGTPLLLLQNSQARILIDCDQHRIVWSQPQPAKAGEKEWHSRSRHLAYTVGNNLYVLTADGKSLQVTQEPEGVVCGQSVHRNEFGISKGIFWSPSGKLLAFYRMDERMVATYPQVSLEEPIAQAEPIRYPMAGQTSHQVQVGIFNPADGQTLYLQAGDPTDRYFTNIAWSPDEQSLFLVELNRDQNHAKLCQYSATSGELLKVLYEEQHPKYVEPSYPILFLPWDERQFIYQSQRDGFNHLYLMSLDGAETRQLTTGDWLVQEVLGFDTKKREIIFSATKESPLQSNLYRVNVKSGKLTPIDNGEGIHRAQLSPSGSCLIDNYSTPDQPRCIDLLPVGGGKPRRLFTADNPYEGYLIPRVETGTLKAADGETELYYRLVKPVDFDPQKKYPVIIYVYGGPHAQLVNGGWMTGARGWDLYMANRGYLVFSLDNRGSENRGLAFENATFRHLGVEECRDQMKGVEFLQSLPYVDSQRIGVHGWSFGGHMTTALMLRYPDTFKVGVAGGPVIDWRYYEVMYGERYMDTPQSNPEGYAETDLRSLAGQLKGHLLMIHDYQDDTCVPQHTLSFIKACVDARTYPDLFIYPGHKHNVLGRDRVHLYEKITRYFDDHL